MIAHFLGQGRAKIHRFGQRQVATIGAGASGNIVDLLGARARQIDRFQSRVDPWQLTKRDEAQHQILVDCNAQQPIPGVSRNRGQRVHLFSG
jgi:hypothetical protein